MLASGRPGRPLLLGASRCHCLGRPPCRAHPQQPETPQGQPCSVPRGVMTGRPGVPADPSSVLPQRETVPFLLHESRDAAKGPPTFQRQ